MRSGVIFGRLGSNPPRLPLFSKQNPEAYCDSVTNSNASVQSLGEDPFIGDERNSRIALD